MMQPIALPKQTRRGRTLKPTAKQAALDNEKDRNTRKKRERADTGSTASPHKAGAKRGRVN